jgi:hypothetical protein
MERSVFSVGQRTWNATTKMSMPTKRIHSLATTVSVLDPKKKTPSRERITTETIFETTIRKILAVRKVRSHQERKTNRSGRKHKDCGLPSVISTICTGAVPDAWSRTLSIDKDGSVRRAKVHAKKSASELARNLALGCKLRRIAAKLLWWMTLSTRLHIAPLAMVARMWIMGMVRLYALCAILLQFRRIPTRIWCISSS